MTAPAETAGGWRHSLRFRLIVASIVVEVAMLAVMIGNNIRQAGAALDQVTATRLSEISETFSIALAPALAARDYASLDSLVQRLVSLPDLTYLRVHDPQDKLLAKAEQQGTTSLDAADIQHGSSTVEIFGQPYGTLRYGLSVAQVRQVKKDLLFQGLVIALIEVTLTMAALSSIAILLTRRLENLTHASRRFAAGDFTTLADGGGTDEVATLAAAFNTMGAAVRRQIRQLEDNADRLGRSSDEWKRLAEITAHHLQEPIRQLVSFSQLALRGADQDNLPPQSRQNLECVIDGAIRLKRLLRDLQTYVAIDLDPVASGEEVDLGQCAQAALDGLQERLGACHAQVRVDPLPRLVGNADQLTMVFTHLIGNAVEHREPDAVLSVVVGTRQDDGDHVTILVTDNGPGIPPAFRKRMFLLFERLDVQGPGTGIGLALVRRVVEAHGGRVWIEAPLSGQGATIALRLPLVSRPG